MAYQQTQYAYPPQGAAGTSYQPPPPVAPAYGQQPPQPIHGHHQVQMPAGYQQPYQPQQAYQQPSYQTQPVYAPQAPIQSLAQAPYQAQRPSYTPQQPVYSQPRVRLLGQPQYLVQQPQQQQQPHYQPQQPSQLPHHQQYQHPQHHQPYPTQPQQQYQHQPQVQPPPQHPFPPGTYPLRTLPGQPLSKPTKLPFSLTLSSTFSPSQPIYTLTYNPTASSLSISRGPPSHPSPPIATASFPSLSLHKSPACLGPYNYQIDAKFVSFSILPGQSLKWAISVSTTASAGALILTPEGREQEVIAKFFGTDAAGKLAVPGGTKKYIEGRIELVQGLSQAQMDEVFLTLGVELERKRRQASGGKTAEGTWWGSEILNGVLSS
ncbi:hypothetical protein QBC41DRAFT_350235 [Cercophora samala]|uniref:Uncharacterized protein n=1 Tax=Cercophora samala TaxID=330535 RepID=A0AA39Z3H3_9PEZI|nr:hypothetical protein QBC41DRAFT_350235 [Cercophora samala]